jgi:hypothetical protein
MANSSLQNRFGGGDYPLDQSREILESVLIGSHELTLAKVAEVTLRLVDSVHDLKRNYEEWNVLGLLVVQRVAFICFRIDLHKSNELREILEELERLVLCIGTMAQHLNDL